MFVVKPVKESLIKKHHCSSLNVAMEVQKYLINKYEEEISVEESGDRLFYSAPGFKVAIEFKYIDIGVINLRIDDILTFRSLVEKVLPEDKNFVRIPGIMYNICISENEFKDIKDFIERNKEYLDTLDDRVNEWFDRSLIK